MWYTKGKGLPKELFCARWLVVSFPKVYDNNVHFGNCWYIPRGGGVHVIGLFGTAITVCVLIDYVALKLICLLKFLVQQLCGESEFQIDCHFLTTVYFLLRFSFCRSSFLRVQEPNSAVASIHQCARPLVDKFCWSSGEKTNRLLNLYTLSPVATGKQPFK